MLGWWTHWNWCEKLSGYPVGAVPSAGGGEDNGTDSKVKMELNEGRGWISLWWEVGYDNARYALRYMELRLTQIPQKSKIFWLG